MTRSGERTAPAIGALACLMWVSAANAQEPPAPPLETPQPIEQPAELTETPLEAPPTPPPTEEALPPGRSEAEQLRRADDSAGSRGMPDEVAIEDLPDIERREVPDLDGRPDAPQEASDVLLWVPRLLLAPFYLVTEYVLRRPIGWFLTTAERDHWDLLDFSGRSSQQFNWGVVPTVLIDFGFRAAAGLYTWFNNVGFGGHSVRLRLAFGGVDWLRFSVSDRIQIDSQNKIEAQVQGWTRADALFAGFGPTDARASRQTRYTRRRLEGALSYTHRPWRASYVRFATGISANEFADSDYVEPPERTISEGIAQGWYPTLEADALPPGFEGYTAVAHRLEGALDTRLPGLGASRSGVRAEAFARVAYDIYRPTERSWIGYGGALGGYWDIHSGRTLGGWIASEFATPLGNEPVPFTELPDFGTRGRMSGFRRGWITGPSAISASLEYRYPIWAALDGFVNASIGNAFGPELSDFAFEDLRMSFMFGLRTIGDPDQAITFQIGFGTEPFSRGLGPDVFRLTIGTQEGF